MSRAVLDATEGSSELTSYVFRMFLEALSDKVRKRKIFIIIWYGFSTISNKPFFVFSSGWIDPFVVRATARMGKGIRTDLRDALIADYVSESISGKALGIH